MLVQADPAVLPVHTGRRAEDLGHGLLGGEPRGQRAGVQLAFRGHEQPVPEARGALKLAAEPLDVYNVYANANNHGAILRGRSWTCRTPRTALRDYQPAEYYVVGAESTHIIKPVAAGNEHALHAEAFCLELSRRIVLTTFASDVRTFAGRTVLVLERYDRRVAGSPVEA
ncbi:hypothetical protein DQ354_02000 [Arthrobacter sp. AQ5-06]|nr:hypothetical protein DQ354_02000 [Arthrobacter sp. AQ5-06]